MIRNEEENKSKEKALEVLRNLEGRSAIRTNPMGNDYYAPRIAPQLMDRLTTNPIEIVHVTENHIVYIDPLCYTRGLNILNSDFIDENWTSYAELIKEAKDKLSKRDQNVEEDELKCYPGLKRERRANFIQSILNNEKIQDI